VKGLETRSPAVEELAQPAAPAGAAPGALASPALSLRAVLRSLRPKQWAKNVLVVAAPGAAGVLSQGHIVAKVALAFVAFCLVSSATYLLNDVRDLESDRLHPTKRHRPIAAGSVSVPLALALGIVLAAAGVAVGALVRPTFLIVLGTRSGSRT